MGGATSNTSTANSSKSSRLHQPAAVCRPVAATRPHLQGPHFLSKAASALRSPQFDERGRPTAPFSRARCWKQTPSPAAPKKCAHAHTHNRNGIGAGVFRILAHASPRDGCISQFPHPLTHPSTHLSTHSTRALASTFPKCAHKFLSSCLAFCFFFAPVVSKKLHIFKEGDEVAVHRVVVEWRCSGCIAQALPLLSTQRAPATARWGR